MRPAVGILSASLVLALAACGGAARKASDKPAKVDPVAHESELMRITLSPEAERQLGIAVTSIATSIRPSRLETFGEVVIPPASSGGLPISATSWIMRNSSRRTNRLNHL